MFFPDIPNVPPQNVPVMIAQANQAQAGSMKKERAFGQCYSVPSNYYDGENALSPLVAAETYFLLYESQTTFTGPSTLTVLQQPQHGVLRLMTEADRGVFFSDTSGPIDPNDPGYIYLPEKGYLGDDKASFLAERGGIKIKVVYFFKAVNGPLGNSGGDEYCEKTGIRWKISSTIDANGSSTITSVEYQSPIIDASATTTDTQVWLRLGATGMAESDLDHRQNGCRMKYGNATCCAIRLSGKSPGEPGSHMKCLLKYSGYALPVNFSVVSATGVETLPA